jgi:hypothetical protein
VTTVIADPHIPSIHPLSREYYDKGETALYTDQIISTYVPSVDVWGVNVYRGNSFQDLFEQWESITTKPMYIGEFGADSYDHRITAENQTAQGEMNGWMWDEIYFNLSAEREDGTAVGGLVFEWNDEWWKNGSPGHHNVSYESNPGQPDGVNDEEWFGLVDINRNAKEAVDVMRGRYTDSLNQAELDANPVLTVTSQGNNAIFQIGDKTALSRAGREWGGRGITAAVLDPHNGLRMSQAKTFDTWQATAGSHRNFEKLIQYLEDIPDGAIVLIGAADEAGFINYNNNEPWNDPYVTQAYEYFEALGSTKVRQVVYNGGWAMVYAKGGAVLGEEAAATKSDAAVVQVQVSLELDPRYGLLDTEAPTGTFFINQGEGVTTSRDITLYFDMEDPSGIQDISYAFNSLEESAFSAWESYASEKQIQLPDSDGNYEVNVRVRDRVGNVALFQETILLDRMGPGGTMVINNGAAVTDQLDVMLNLAVSDEGAGLGPMRFTTDSENWTWSDWEDFQPEKSFRLPSVAGNARVYCQIYDRAWNLSTFYADIQVVDTVPPAASMLINGGAVETDQLDVTLTLTASDNLSGLGPMRFTTDSENWTWSDWEDFQPEKSFTLPPVAGHARIYWQIYDRSWNLSTVYADIQVVDTVPPAASMVINGGAAETNQLEVTLSLTASDNLAGLGPMRFTTDSTNWIWSDWEEYHPVRQFTLPVGDGNKRVYWQIYDQSWNLSTAYADILLDTVPPTGAFTIDNGAEYTTLREVQLNISASDAGSGVFEMSFAFNGSADGDFSDWEPFSASKSVELPDEDGVIDVYVRVRDAAGNVTLLWNSIDYDPNLKRREYALLRSFLNPANNESRYGNDLAAVGTNILVGAPADNQAGADSGLVYYRNGDPESPSFGDLIMTLSNPNTSAPAGDWYGYSVTGFKKYGVVSAPGTEQGGIQNAGAVYLYDLDPDSSAYGQVLQTFANPNPVAESYFGSKLLSVDDKYLFIAVTGNIPSPAVPGTVYMFDADPASPAFGQLLHTFDNPEIGQMLFFGLSMAQVGKNILISSPNFSLTSIPSGAAYLFNADPSSPQFGSLLKTFRTPDAAKMDEFGSAVSAMGDYIFINAVFSGKTYMYDADPSSTQFGNLVRTFSTGLPGALYYTDNDQISVIGKKLVVSCDIPIIANPNAAGAVYLFDADPQSPSFGQILQGISNPNPNAEDFFGYSLLGYEGNLLIGSPLDQTSASYDGAFYFYRIQ